jgi:hypothetical protein
MYEIHCANSKTEKRLREYLSFRHDIAAKLNRLKEKPREANGAHPLAGKLTGK